MNMGVFRKDYIDKLDDLLKGTNQVITITGARRSGKSYIMRQMCRRLIDNGVDKNNILFVNFEDPRFTQLDSQLLAQVFELYRSFYSPENMPWLFFDEIQEVTDWEKWVRMMHELNKAKIIVSGSNAKLLSREQGTLLTGRHIDLTVFPLTFSEYLQFKGVKGTQSTGNRRTSVPVYGGCFLSGSYLNRSERRIPVELF